MIRTALYRPGQNTVSLGAEEQIEQWRGETDSVMWLDIEHAELAQERDLLQQFQLHPLAIEDAQRTRRPPKVEEFDNFLFLLLRGLDATTTDIEFGVIQLALFVGDRFLITRHDKPSTSANHVWENLTPEIMAAGPGGLVAKIAGRLQRRYVEILLELEPRLDEIEEEMFEQPNDQQLAELTSYKSKLRHLSRIATYHENIFLELKDREQKHLPATLVHELTDVYEQTERSQSLADLYYNVASDLVDSYLALSSHRLNGVMQVLTIITVIFVPLTFIAGIYGMNFENIPELKVSFGYFVVMAVMFLIAALQLVYFKRKRWM